MKELWRTVEDYEGLYYVSNFGRIKSVVREGTKGGIRTLSRSFKGYLYVSLCKKGIQNTFRVNRLVAQAFILNPESKSEVNHKDGNKENNRVGNLGWTTHQENMDHAKLGNLIPRGENSARTNLTDKDVLLIREYLKDESYSIKQIAQAFNTTQRAVSLISLGKSWCHLLKESDNTGKHRHAKGSENAASKLNDDKVREIRRLLSEGKFHREIGKTFGVDKAVIGRINKGTAWAHVK